MRVERIGPSLRLAARGEVERWLEKEPCGHGVHRLGAPGLQPALPQPGWQVRVLAHAVEKRRAFAADAAQDAVDERAKVARFAILQREANGQVDRRVVGRVEKEDLHGAEMEDGLQAAPHRPAGQALGKATLEDQGDLSASAQGGASQRAGQRPVAGLERCHR